MSTLDAFVRDFGGHAGRRGASAIALILAGGVLEGAGLALLVPMLALLTGSGGAEVRTLSDRLFGALGAATLSERFAVLLVPFVLLVFLRAVVLARRDRKMAEVQLAFVEHHRLGLLAALGNSRWSDIAALRHARVLHALEDNIASTSGAAQVTLVLLASAVMLVAQWLLILAIYPLVALAAALLMAIGAALAVPLLRRAKRSSTRQVTQRYGLFEGASQLLGGLKFAVAQNLQIPFLAAFDRTARDLTAERLALLRRYSRSRIIGTSAGAIVGALIVLVAVMQGASVVALIAALAVLTRMIGPATTIQQNAQYLVDYLPGYAALIALRRELDRKQPASAPAGDLIFSGDVVLDRVTYAYHEGNPDRHGLSEVSLTIAPGEIVGIVGGSGAGKTTFVDVVSGLLIPTVGALRVGNVAIDDANAAAWQRHIAYVGQETFLFHDTIRANLLIGNDDVGADEIDRALQIARAGFVAALPQGLHTIVAERGTRLSGGERQRIALARALLRRPRLLILDEATNAIDVPTERAILDGLATLSPRPTILIVAHRAETLARCTRLVELAEGRLLADRPTAPPS